MELGVDLFDTADAYGPHLNEELVRESLAPYPAGLVLATKGGLVRPNPDEWVPQGHPAYLRQCIELSLRRLGVDEIALYQLHRIDPAVPVEEQVGVLAEAQAAGKVRHIGLSEVSIEQLDAARAVTRIASVQNMYHLGNRGSDAVLRACEARGIAFIPFFPLGNGELLGDERLQRVASRVHATPAQVAIAWLLQRSPVVVPIPGTSSVAHLEENLAAAEVRLAEDDIAELDAIA